MNNANKKCGSCGPKFWNYVKKLALAFWIGEMLFFAAVFAPRVFRVLPREMAGQLQAAIFPPYFLGGIISAAFLIAALFFLRHTLPRRRLQFNITLLAVSGGIFVYLYAILGPQITALRPLVAADPSAAAGFASLHKVSVGLNGTALIALLILLALF